MLVFWCSCIGKAIGSTPGEYKELLYEPNTLLSSNGSLLFKKITKDAQGHFLCEAKNNIGAGVSKVIFLKVNGEYGESFCSGAKLNPKLHEHIKARKRFVFFVLTLVVVVVVDDTVSTELIELRTFRVLVLIHSASTFYNEKQTNFCRKRQTGTRAVQCSGRYTNRHQMENTKYTTAFRRIAGYKVHASFCSELYLCSLYSTQHCAWMYVWAAVCIWAGVYLKLKSQKRQREMEEKLENFHTALSLRRII